MKIGHQNVIIVSPYRKVDIQGRTVHMVWYATNRNDTVQRFVHRPPLLFLFRFLSLGYMMMNVFFSVWSVWDNNITHLTIRLYSVC